MPHQKLSPFACMKNVSLTATRQTQAYPIVEVSGLELAKTNFPVSRYVANFPPPRRMRMKPTTV